MDRLKDILLIKFNSNKTLLVIIFFMFSVIYYFSGIFFGLDYSDTFYHLNHAIQPPNDLHLYTFLLSSILIKFLIELSGYELIMLRFINSLLFFFAIICPFIILKTRKPKIDALFYISCILILMAPLNYNILGYDTLTIFILAILFSVLVLYLKKSNSYLLIILAILSSVVILIRLPNIVLIPIVFLSVLFKEGKPLFKITSSGIKSSFLYVFLTILFIILGYYLYYEDWKTLKSSTLISHNPKILIYRYFIDGVKLILYLSFILSNYLLFKYFRNIKYKLLLYASLIGLQCFFLLKFILFTPHSGNYSLYLTSIAFSILIIHTYYNKLHKYDFKQWIIYLFFLFLFINPLGSDTGFLKAASLLLLFPFILNLIDLKLKKFWFLILITLIPLSILQKASVIYQDFKITDLNKTLDINLLYPIRTSEIRYEHLKTMDNEVRELQKKDIEVFFYGNNSHIFQYLYPENSLNIKSFRQPLDTLIFLPEIEKVIFKKDKIALFLVTSYPETKSKNNLSLLEVELIKRDFEKVEQDSLIYYLR